jgi:formate dehydrogenase
MPVNGMTPHISGTSLSAQGAMPPARWRYWRTIYAGTPIRDKYLIVDGGVLASTGAKSHKLT